MDINATSNGRWAKVLVSPAVNPDMVDSCQEKKELPANCFSAVLVRVIFQGTQRGGTGVTTVDHSDIRGLDTA
jgi:hypothetical protein